MGITHRLVFLGAALFWVLMNVLLWRSEFGSANLASSLPAAMVWDKILTAPDHSSLEIFQRGKKVGFCRWTPSINQAPAQISVSGDDTLEGMVKTPSGYTVDFEGSLASDISKIRLRLNLHVELDTNRVWQLVRAHAIIFKTAWDLEAKASSQTVTIKTQGDDVNWSRTFSFEQLREPDKLLAELGLELPPGLLALPGGVSIPQAAAPMTWQAFVDHLKLGHSNLRVYRLQTRLLDRWPILVITTRVGEILRVELPGDLIFQNEVLQF